VLNKAKVISLIVYLLWQGVYPYSYMTGPEKFAETQLPPIEVFHSILEDEPCTQENYDRAREIWAHYNIKTMRDYHDHYLLSDVLLLADVFENFINSIYEQHRLDPRPFYNPPLTRLGVGLKIHKRKTRSHYRS